VSRAGLATLFAVALVVRLGVVAATPGYVPIHDDHDYDRVAWAMASGRGYPPIHGPHHRRYADAYRPPLWPVALGAVYALAGHDIAAGRVADALLGALGVLALVWVARRLLGRRAAWWAGAIGAVYVPLALVSSVLVSETLFVLLELVALGLALEARRRARPLAWAVAAGAIVGLAWLTRLNGVLLLAAVLPLAAVPGRRLLGPAVALAACALVVAPWTIRNAIALHAFVPVSTESGPTLAGTYNEASMHDRVAPGSWYLLRYTEYARIAARRLPPAREDALLRHAALRFIVSHPAYPLTVVRENLRRWLDLAGLPRARFEAQTADIRPHWADASLPFAWVLAGLAIAGLVTGAVRWNRFWLAPAALLASTLLVNAETPRFRAPLDPFLILLAAAFIVAPATRHIGRDDARADPLRRHRRRPRPASGAAR
jgi:4-amino-4-deoxy-L-arabinose transferase-like glycosyltransferase